MAIPHGDYLLIDFGAHTESQAQERLRRVRHPYPHCTAILAAHRVASITTPLCEVKGEGWWRSDQKCLIKRR